MKTLQDVMSQPVQVARADDVGGTVRDLMLDGELHGVPVVDHDGRLVGIVTGSDLVEEWSPQQGIVTVMSDRVRTASPFTTVVDAARTMLSEQIHHVVVTLGDEIVGMVSSFDLLEVLAGRVEAAESLDAPARRAAQSGDLVVIRGHSIDHSERRGLITEIRGTDGGPPWVVRWLDDPHDEPHDVLFFPGSDADVEPRTGGAET